ncbi:hypothetical protein DFH08DRAFT_886501 [Mycena albidolilacea]|uniref:Uncharacterized protein n=1 Tax=Mycena albidolilacea TaxID=1033008 RepID=A0AAD6ZJF0_9AGAR|nr:hypothetical protein DFH08DRAFT_886501 [Mycena albidolilacea]
MSPAEEAYFAHAYTVGGDADVPLRAGAQDAVERARPEHADRVRSADEAKWADLRRRNKELPRTIFAIADEPVTWPGADDDGMGPESISHPEVEQDAGVDDGDVSSALHAPSPNASHCGCTLCGCAMGGGRRAADNLLGYVKIQALLPNSNSSCNRT